MHFYELLHLVRIYGLQLKVHEKSLVLLVDVLITILFERKSHVELPIRRFIGCEVKLVFVD